ncbi:MAG: peptidoglycan DD-metalloendopeptidase family protein [Gammaproteobacteria bacterium]|nr:peptidoglycan DD-metalloendopeptidase family protein [Gammaproteobacteria bacterium]
MGKIQQVLHHYPSRHFRLLIASCGLFVLLISLLPSSPAAAKKTTSLAADAAETEQDIASPITGDTLHIPPNPPTTSKLEIPQKKTTVWLERPVKKGDTLSSLFASVGLNDRDLLTMLNNNKQLHSQLTRIHPGQTLYFDIKGPSDLQQLRYQINSTDTLHIQKSEEPDTYIFETISKQYDIKLRYAHTDIIQSLFVDAEKAGLSDNLIMELATLFGWDIDFALDIRAGDSFDLIYEELFLNGEKVKNGKIIAANFFNRGKRFTAIHYEDSSDQRGYYTENGASVRKEFSRTPVDFARISSRFNLRRKHPILHKFRAHKGVDYAASRGTPVKATGDGKVILAGTKGGYGRTVILQHGQKYTTLYAHLNKYGRGIRNGKRVRQGQVIGYIGSSGMATGPHLHYEFRVNGAHRNPLTVELPRADALKGKAKERFFASTGEYRQQLIAFASARALALNEL